MNSTTSLLQSEASIYLERSKNREGEDSKLVLFLWKMTVSKYYIFIWLKVI